MCCHDRDERGGYGRGGRDRFEGFADGRDWPGRGHDDCGCGGRERGEHRGYEHRGYEHRGHEHHGHEHPGYEPSGRDCCCDDHGPGEGDFGFRRRFVSNAELIEALEAYLKELENEAQGVREAIAEMKAESKPAEPPKADEQPRPES